MTIRRNVLTLSTMLAILCLALPLHAADAPKPAPGVDPGQLTGLSIKAGGADAKEGASAVVRGQEGRLQVVVTGQFTGDQVRDLTRQVKFNVSPANICKVDANGMVTPLAEGEATVTAIGPDNKTASVKVKVADFVSPPRINFKNQITPIFTKTGCNGGGCHGKSGGQNGFRLSLLGFEPQEDYEYLVKEGRARRLFPAAPDYSLLLLKAANIVPHGGGERITKDSHDYRLIKRWIAQGMPYGSPEDPVVTGLEVYPKMRVLTPEGKQQLRVLAKYSDGSVDDVTHTAQYEPNDKEIGEVNMDGLVSAMGRPGDVGIMIRYQGHVGVFRATIPLGAPVENLPKPANYIDEAVFAKLQLLGMPPSETADDATFLRRVTLDLTGRLPKMERAKAFLEDKDPNKREKYVDELLASTAYADYFANKWSAILRNKRRQDTYTHGTFGFHAWIREALHSNMPYNKFVANVIAASGEPGHNPPAVWYREVQKPEEQMEDVAQLFMGIRMQCAKCHHHPFEVWSQEDYYGFTAFFSRVGRKNGLRPNEQVIYHNPGTASARNLKTGQPVKPTGLGSEPMDIAPERDPRLELAAWLGAEKNPFFARSLVNRYWKHFFSRGVVEPEDDMRATNPATNPELLDAMAKNFIKDGFDMKKLVKTIVMSETYQRSCFPNGYNKDDKQNFSRFYPRRLNAEVLLDAIDEVTGKQSSFSGLPTGTRAVQIPDHGGVNSYFLTVFGKPEGSSVCECERSGDANLAQSLHLINSREIQDKLSQGRAATLARDKRSDDEKITELYYRAFSRPPVAEELKIAKTYLTKYEEKDKKLGYEDLIWALINTKEFLFNH